MKETPCNPTNSHNGDGSNASSSCAFLSGEADPKMLKHRFPFLMVDDTDHTNNTDNDTSSNASNNKYKKGPMIQVMNESSDGSPNKDDKDKSDEDDDDDNEEDDLDMPPPLFNISQSHSSIGTVSTSTTTTTTAQTPKKIIASENAKSSATSTTESISLMENMMKEAAKVQAEKQKKKLEIERKQSKKSSFGSGFQKGFLSKNTASTKSKGGKKGKSKAKPDVVVKKSTNKSNNAQQNTNTQTEEIYELDKEGNLVAVAKDSSEISSLSSPPPLLHSQPQIKSSKTKDNIPTIKPKHDYSNPHINNNNNPLVFDEVQQAMKHKLEKDVDTWATPEIMEQIMTQHPKLMEGFSNPKYMASLKRVQHNPNAMKYEMEQDPEFAAYMKEFLNVMGNHFISVDQNLKQQQQQANANVNANVNANAFDMRETKDLGPFVEASLKKLQSKEIDTKSTSNKTTPSNTHHPDETPNMKQHNEKKPASNTSHKTSSPKANNHHITTDDVEEEQQVQKILQDKELTQILMDPHFQRIMQECSIPGKIQQYMHHPEYGRKLRKLMEAGLLRFA